MKLVLASALVLLLPANKPAATVAVATTPAAASEPAPQADSKPGDRAVTSTLPGDEAKPYLSRRVACDKIQLVWMSPSGSIFNNAASVVVVEDGGGTSGVRFFVDREHGTIVATQAWREPAGNVRGLTTLPGSPRIDYVDCREGETEGGISVEYYDAKESLPY
jgi:hypothetical protein